MKIHSKQILSALNWNQCCRQAIFSCQDFKVRNRAWQSCTPCHAFLSPQRLWTFRLTTGCFLTRNSFYGTIQHCARVHQTKSLIWDVIYGRAIHSVRASFLNRSGVSWLFPVLGRDMPEHPSPPCCDMGTMVWLPAVTQLPRLIHCIPVVPEVLPLSALESALG